MTWFLIIVLAVVVLVAVLAVLVLAAPAKDENGESERLVIEQELRRAEHRLHDLARDSFEAMLAEARAHAHRGVKS
jgi:cytochrome c-type biogenesis protein CcmH/NrfG